MKKPILLAISSFLFLVLVLTNSGNPPASLAQINAASLLSINEQESPLSTEEWAAWEPLLNTLTSTGFSIEADGQVFTFPAQEKDFIFERNGTSIQLNFTDAFYSYIFETVGASVNVPSSDITLLSADASKTSRVEMEGVVADGRELIPGLTQEMIEAALIQKESTAQGVMRDTEGRIINKTGLDLGPLELLTQGKSSFWGSSPEREFNIKKALNERFNGILIPPGAEFSYVEFLGEIEYAGWKQAYAIFKGTQLEPTPAGGVCQVSTTIYRAVLNGALNVTEHRSHSLYVIYYQHFGDGLDATIFPGEQDFKFVNDSPNYILMVAQEEGFKEAVIRFYGEDDGRSTELYGPYTASTQTEEVKTAIGAPLGIGQIAWKYVITHPDGSKTEEWLLSDYMSPAQQHRGETPGLLEY